MFPCNYPSLFTAAFTCLVYLLVYSVLIVTLVRYCRIEDVDSRHKLHRCLSFVGYTLVLYRLYTTTQSTYSMDSHDGRCRTTRKQ